MMMSSTDPTILWDAMFRGGHHQYPFRGETSSSSKQTSQTDMSREQRARSDTSGNDRSVRRSIPSTDSTVHQEIAAQFGPPQASLDDGEGAASTGGKLDAERMNSTLNLTLPSASAVSQGKRSRDDQMIDSSFDASQLEDVSLGGIGILVGPCFSNSDQSEDWQDPNSKRAKIGGSLGPSFPGANYPLPMQDQSAVASLPNAAIAGDTRDSPQGVLAVGGSLTPLKLSPTKADLDELLTPRSREALTVWYERLTELNAFREANGHCNVPQKYEENAKLGIWVNKQRCSKDSLSEDKRAALNAVGFDWGKKKGDHAWNEKFAELKQYKNTHGNCLVPTKYPQNTSLGRWVSTQRSQYKLFQANAKSTLSHEKVTKLTRLGFAWSMVD